VACLRRSPPKVQPQARVARIGVIPSGSPATSAASVDAVPPAPARARLYGRNIAIEVRYGVAQPERSRDLAAEFVGLGVDVIVASCTLATRAAKQATTTIPIVGMRDLGWVENQGFDRYAILAHHGSQHAAP
jgi:putative ABC transport system substrate-binding protein